MLSLLKFYFNPKAFYKSKRGSYKLTRWSRAVRKRDKHCLKCGSKKSLEAHHIFSKAIYPRIAFRVDNGITLCKNCHRMDANSYHSMYRNKGGREELEEWLRVY